MAAVQPIENPRGVRWLLAAIGGMLLAVAGEGPDFGHYADWAWAVLHGNIFELRGNVLSLVGVPFTIAGVGPGLLFAAGKAVLFPLPFSVAAIVTGWAAAVTFWAASFVLLRRLAHGDIWLALLGMAALFVGTHAGMYSHAYSTEVFAGALVALLWALAITRQQWRVLDAAAVGALTGLLLLVRPHVVMYALPALWMAVSNGAIGALSMPRLIAVVVPIVAAATEYGVVNRWMTGAPWHPPYLYGGEGFSSVDMTHPALAAVLLHPLHGLLSYHPLYGVAFVATLIAAWRARFSEPWWWMTVLAVMAHVWVQAGWYIWWLGGSTFGMRGVSPAALPLVAGLVVTMRSERSGAYWLWLVLVACAWSYPLLLQGNSQFLTWSALLGAQRPAMFLVALLLVAWVVLRRSSGSHLGKWCALILLALVPLYLVREWGMRPAPVPHALAAAIGAVAILLVHRVTVRRGSRGLAMIALVVFALQAGLFWRLAVRTEQHLASGMQPPRPFDYVGNSPVDELRVTYAEYLEVPGFEDRKAAFRQFLAWQRVEVSPTTPVERQMAHAFRRRVAADALFKSTLVEAIVRDGVVFVLATGLSDAQESRAHDLARDVGARSVTFLQD